MFVLTGIRINRCHLYLYGSEGTEIVFVLTVLVLTKFYCTAVIVVFTEYKPTE